ncbi:PREDICTED: uncharacterized protein LOC106887375 isoform X2 [Calidris pugnax]|uniref:uncharacterized protein LOC106887375 isoform X2 n=1 Tax=Calidris pugnax TaxID=198806 RepID=UPI00071CAEDB|nr:PREDICTED: uncharacterized protein LOC106887375 isoform X2 [Calidris pugnax]
MVEQVYTEGLQAGEEEQHEDAGEAERSCYGLTTAHHSPSSCVSLGGGSKGVRNGGVKREDSKFPEELLSSSYKKLLRLLILCCTKLSFTQVPSSYKMLWI